MGGQVRMLFRSYGQGLDDNHLGVVVQTWILFHSGFSARMEMC